MIVPGGFFATGAAPDAPPELIYDYTYSTPTPAAFAEKYANGPDDQIEILAGDASGFKTTLSEGFPAGFGDPWSGVTDPLTPPSDSGYEFVGGLYAGYVKQVDDSLIFILGSFALECVLTGDNFSDFDTLYARGPYINTYEFVTEYFYIWDLGSGEIPIEFSSTGGAMSVAIPALSYNSDNINTSVLLTNSSGSIIDSAGGSTQFSADDTVTVTVQNNTVEPLDNGWNITIRNFSAGDLEIIADTGVTITPPDGGTLFIPRLYAAKITRTGVNTFTMTGVTVPE